MSKTTPTTTWRQKMPPLAALCDPHLEPGLPVCPVEPIAHRRGSALLVYDARTPPPGCVAALWEDPPRAVWTQMDVLRVNLAHPLGFAWACRALVRLAKNHQDIRNVAQRLLSLWARDDYDDDDRLALAGLLHVVLTARPARGKAVGAVAMEKAAAVVEQAAAAPGTVGDRVEVAAADAAPVVREVATRPKRAAKPKATKPKRVVRRVNKSK